MLLGMVTVWSKLDGNICGSIGHVLEAGEAMEVEVDLVPRATPLSGVGGLVGIFEVGCGMARAVRLMMRHLLLLLLLLMMLMLATQKMRRLAQTRVSIYSSRSLN